MRSFIDRVSECRRDNRGQAAMFFGLALAPLLLTAGAAIDLGRASQARSALQDAVDAGTLAAAKTPELPLAQREQIARSTVRANLGPLANLINPNVSAVSPSAGQIQVTATAALPTTVMKLMRLQTIDLSATATAANAVAGSQSKVCILAKSATASPGLLANAFASLNAPGCEIHVASQGNPAATFNSSVDLKVARICVAGKNLLLNSATLPMLQTDCKTASDPFEATLPTVSAGACTVSGQTYSGEVTVSPGVYCGGFNFNGSGKLTLNPGLYVFKSAVWNLNTGWTIVGSGVTFYFADKNSYVQINGGVPATLTAPTSGAYADILMFEPKSLERSPLVVNGGSGHVFQGLMYLPSRDLTFNNMSNLTAEKITLVVNSIILNTSNWNFQSAGKAIQVPGAAPSVAKLVK